MGKNKNVRRLRRVRKIDGLNKADIAILGMEREQKVLGGVMQDRRPYTQRIRRGALK